MEELSRDTGMAHQNIIPVVGMGVTEYCGSDCNPYTVVAVTNSRTITIQEDKATRTDTNGMSEVQEYTYGANKHGWTLVITLRADGRWYERGKKGFHYYVGDRRKYFNYSL